MSEADLDERLPEAVNGWSRSVFGGPRELMDLVVGVPEARDESLERVFTRVVRREISETFTATRETRSTRPRLDPSAIDPFAYSDEAALKADSEYVRQCGACSASGSVRCARCSGTGKMRCGNCNGSGKELKYYKTRSPKLINCKRCRAAGTVRCADCTGSGALTCPSCLGSGHILAWLTIDQTEHAHVTISPDSAVIAGHPALTEKRELVPGDVAAFAVTEKAVSDGPLEAAGVASGPYREADTALVQDHLSRVHPRLERVTRQQYLKLSVVRRDVTYEMCGTSGTLVLSGNDLAPSATPEALRPIKRRLWFWGASLVLLAAILAVVRGTLVGSAEYFFNVRVLTGALLAVGMAASIPTLGSLLRAWRGGGRFWPIPAMTKVGLAAVAVCGVAIAGVGLIVRPSVAEVQSALEKGDVARARTVVDALKEETGNSTSALDADDRVRLAEAKALKGDARLKVLDAVAARGGPAAKEAAAAARADRLTVINDELAEKNSADALASLDRWFANSTDADVAEDRARAHEIARATCTTDVCRLDEATKAAQAHGTPQRTAQVDADRKAVNAALDPKQVNATATLQRLQQARTLRDNADEVLKAFPTDTELVSLARAAQALAQTERSKVPLLRSPVPVVEELFESKSQQDSKTVAHFALDGVTVYVSLDSSQRCGGLYAVGSGGERTYVSTLWPPERLISQAVGHPAKLHQPTQGAQATAKWYEAGFPVVARWRDSDLIELRIGDATP